MYYIFKGNTEDTNIEDLVDDFCTFYVAGKDNKLFSLIIIVGKIYVCVFYVYIHCIFMIHTRCISMILSYMN